jgi:hypothetical protein
MGDAAMDPATFLISNHANRALALAPARPPLLQIVQIHHRRDQ